MSKNPTSDQITLAADLMRVGPLPVKLLEAAELVLLAALRFGEPDASGESVEHGGSDSRSTGRDVGSAEVSRRSGGNLRRSLGKAKAALVNRRDTHGSVPSSEGSDKSVAAAGTRRGRRLSKRKTKGRK